MSLTAENGIYLLTDWLQYVTDMTDRQTWQWCESSRVSRVSQSVSRHRRVKHRPRKRRMKSQQSCSRFFQAIPNGLLFVRNSRNPNHNLRHSSKASATSTYILLTRQIEFSINQSINKNGFPHPPASQWWSCRHGHERRFPQWNPRFHACTWSFVCCHATTWFCQGKFPWFLWTNFVRSLNPIDSVKMEAAN